MREIDFMDSFHYLLSAGYYVDLIYALTEEIKFVVMDNFCPAKEGICQYLLFIGTL
jgi:hypothetical protein